jgi:hypothetical protein
MNLYSVVGWYQYDRPRDKRLEGRHWQFGRLLHDPDEKRIVHGDLIDPWKTAQFEGMMSEAHLQFTKLYGDFSDRVEYQLIKRNGVWIGEWQGKSSTGIAQLWLELKELNASEYALHLPRDLLDHEGPIVRDND